ncbi:prepilin-type N-terminal cleavage/methylation domain-containing protein [Glaciihabitans sp. UYNi722]|uniref:prepilin-type N-terminal cleavage/methylation domain-containing protein n=1 Tax=Glaciihabitans sp. UYNi722 TaxID=3156344 RepID=UPI0033993303
MKRLRERFSVVTADESGLTLIEVIVAISIIGIISTAAIALSITSLNSASTQQRRDIAITVANQTLEAVSSQTATMNAAGLSPLYANRGSNQVVSNWDAVSGVDEMYPAWDSSASTPNSNGSTLFPVVSPVITQSGTDFTVKTIMGICYQPKAGGLCDRTNPTSAPSSTPAGFSQLLRIIVVVRWTAGSTCQGDTCSYVASTLIDPHSDLEWRSNG